MDINFIDKLLAQRANVNEQQRAYFESITREGRMPSAEENENIKRYDADYANLSEQIDEWTARREREKEADTARAAFEPLVRPGFDTQSPEQQVRSELERFFRGGESVLGSGYFDIDLKPTIQMRQQIKQGADEREIRALYTDGGAAGGSLVVPVGFYNQIYTYIEEASGVRKVARILTSEGGGAWTFPKTTTIAVGTQVSGQGTTLAGTDPVLGTMRLDSYRYGELIKVSTQMLRDTGFDLLGYVAQQIGYAVGRKAGSDYVNGGGSTGPNGIITAASVGAKTGGSLIALGGGASTAFTQAIDPLIVLQHSVAEGYAEKGSFMMNRYTAGTLRLLRDQGAGTIGSYVWTPVTTFSGIGPLGPTDNLLGSPVVYDWNFGTQGSAVKTVAFGDWSTYYVRDVGSFRFERSDDRYFDTDEIGFRGILETDSDLIDTNAIKLLQQLA